MDIRASKVGCTLRFFEEGGRGLVAGTLEAVLHLFEHHYHPALVPFWYGAAEVAWDASRYLAAFSKTPIHQQVGRVELDDARRGRAVAFAGFGSQLPGDEPHIVVGLFGISALRPPATPPEGPAADPPC